MFISNRRSVFLLILLPVSLWMTSVHAGDAPPEVQSKQVDTVESKKGSGSANRRRQSNQSSNSFSMKAQASRVFDFLNEDQKSKAVYAFHAEEREEWIYRPTPRAWSGVLLPKHAGISIMDLTPDQRLQVSHLLDTVLSSPGMDAVSAAVESDEKAGSFLERLIYQYGPENYYLAFFGTPRDALWGWRFEGHMISLNFTVRNQEAVELSPAFIGTKTGQVQLSRGPTAEVLKPTVQAVRELVQSLDSSQLKRASALRTRVPKALVYAPGVFGQRQALRETSKGLSYKDMTGAQKALTIQVVEKYLAQYEGLIQTTNRNRVQKTLSQLEFVWSGDDTMQNPFYFRIQSSAFVFEFLAVDAKAGEYHSVWMNF